MSAITNPILAILRGRSGRRHRKSRINSAGVGCSLPL